MTKKHRNGHMIKCDWLDRLSFREIEMINERQKRESNFLYLMIEFPQIVYDNQEYTVVFFEKVGVFCFPCLQYMQTCCCISKWLVSRFLDFNDQSTTQGYLRTQRELVCVCVCVCV